VGLFWQIDTRDAMEKSIGGDGYRTPLNSYMLADARAIAEFARDAHQPEIAGFYMAKSDTLERLIESKLWNPKDEFYEDLSPSSDSGIRAQKKFVDPGTTLQFAGVRELIGYIPWQFYAPTPSHAVAWSQLFDPHGFAGKYGPTTAECRSPRFRFASSDQCTWNGPSWPYATTQALLGLANLLNGPAQSFIGSEQYYQLFSNYVHSQHIKLPSVRVIDWIDEDLDADTDEWIAKDMLIAKNEQVGRGNYYNHSGFADPLITGLIGLRPRLDSRVVVNPLLPVGSWTYFAIDGLPYHGHLLAIVFDETGNRIWFSLTPDFNTFSKPAIFFDPGYVTIDATIFRGATGPYPLIFKQQTYDPLTFQERVATGPTLEGPWSNISGPINESWSEGPSCIQVGNQYIVFYDHYRAPRARFEAVATTDWVHWQDITAQTSLPPYSKHGSFLHITDEEASRLLARHDAPVAAPSAPAQ
jgi:hypothetical protein